MKTKKLKMNVRLLRRIQREMLKEPARVEMKRWAIPAKVLLESYPRRKSPSCGTVGCIAGWGLMLTKGRKKTDYLGISKVILHRQNSGIQREAEKLLRITKQQGKHLFHQREWPDKFRWKLDKLNEGTAAYARVVCQRIDHFIKTKGAE